MGQRISLGAATPRALDSEQEMVRETAYIATSIHTTNAKFTIGNVVSAIISFLPRSRFLCTLALYDKSPLTHYFRNTSDC